MAASYPEVKNPLLKYALQALREAGASGQQPLTMMEPFHGGRPEVRGAAPVFWPLSVL